MVLLPLQQLPLPVKSVLVLVRGRPEVLIIPGGVTGLGSFGDVDESM